jgi:DNA-binding IclR family transcriptional regulator
MTLCSPGVERVAAILNFMAEHPDRAVSVSDLVRALKISRTTCYDLVTSLAHVGYLHRTNDNTYVLGPSLALVGQIAARHASPVLIAQPEMRALAEEFDVICSAFFRDGDYLVVRERVASGSNLDWSSPKGARVRMRAPFAGIFYAWSPPARAEAWLQATTPSPTEEQTALMQRAMAFARQYGFTFSVRNARSADLPDDATQAFEDADTDLPVTMIPELDPDREYPLMSVLSPVFDTSHEVLFLLALVGFTRKASGREIEHIGRRLRAACDHISGFIGGARPDAPESQALSAF